MWCPRCNRQYDDDFDTCIQCGCELEDYTPILEDDQRELLEVEETDQTVTLEPSEELTPELLASVVGHQEAHRLTVLLEGLRIPCLCRLSEEEFPLMEESGEEDQDATGEPEEIYDLLVPKMLMPKALRILEEDSAGQEESLLEDQLPPELCMDEGTEAVPEEETTPKNKRGFFGLFGKK